MLLLIWFKILVSGQKQIFKQTDTEWTEQPDQKHAFFLVVCQSIPANVMSLAVNYDYARRVVYKGVKIV